jgi:hypothetical protein
MVPLDKATDRGLPRMLSGACPATRPAKRLKRPNNFRRLEEITMFQRTAILLTSVLLAATPLAAAPADVCRPAGPPQKPVNSEDFNPGLGGAIGLNDDFHDDLEDPFDHPGAVISDLSRTFAQDDEPGGVHILKDVAGRDCSSNQ